MQGGQMRILLVGGSKSGKSGLAQQLAVFLSDRGRLYYWAAMEPVDSEDELRIEKHIADREGLGFSTIECGRDIMSAVPEDRSTVLFDSLTALLANEMFGNGFDPGAPQRAAADVLALSERVKNFVCVCDDIFRDGTHYSAETETYLRGLALICRRLSNEFDVVCEVVGGIPHVLKGELPHYSGSVKGLREEC